MVMLEVERNVATKSIEANWCMNVCHDEANKIIYSQNDLDQTFETYKGWGKFLPEIEDDNNYTVTINISKWIVNN